MINASMSSKSDGGDKRLRANGLVFKMYKHIDICIYRVCTHIHTHTHTNIYISNYTTASIKKIYCSNTDNKNNNKNVI